MLSILSTLFFFVLTLALLIAFHEFGHFYVARKCRVHVIRFSIGFGKPLLRWVDKKGTEFVLAAIPLGGYVKMLGESPTETVPEGLKSEAFSEKSVWARMAIVAAGPLFNFLLAIIALWGMFVIGITSLAPIIGKVNPGSIAAHAHLKKMDEFMTINDVPVNNWRDVQMALISSIGDKTPLLLRLYNMKTRMYHFSELNLMNWTLNENDTDVLEALGVTPAFPPITPVIHKVYRNLPGAKAGLVKGDRILAVNGERIHDWIKVVAIVQKSPNQKLVLTIRRDNQLKEIIIYPEAKKSQGQTYGFIGVEAKPPRYLKEVWVRTEHRSFFSAWKPAIDETWNLIKVSFGMIAKLLTGTLSFHTISGPIGMAQWAGQAIQLGWAYYLSFIALISVSLGVLNLLPVPILDGGHLLYCVFEVILRRPLSERMRLMGMRLGGLLLVGLMFLAVFNDLSRFNLS